MSEWLTPNEALQHVVAIEMNPLVAKQKIIQEIKRGTVPAKAATYSSGSLASTEHFLPPDHLRQGNVSVDLNFDSGEARITHHNFVMGQPPFSVGHATGLVLGRRQLLKIWPEQPQPIKEPDHPVLVVRRGAGGAPTKYDWASAAGYMAGFIVENDYPMKAEATTILSKWFADSGFEPDKRDLQKFIAALYEQRKN